MNNLIKNIHYFFFFFLKGSSIGEFHYIGKLNSDETISKQTVIQLLRSEPFGFRPISSYIAKVDGASRSNAFVGVSRRRLKWCIPR